MSEGPFGASPIGHPLVEEDDADDTDVLKAQTNVDPTSDDIADDTDMHPMSERDFFIDIDATNAQRLAMMTMETFLQGMVGLSQADRDKMIIEREAGMLFALREPAVSMIDPVDDYGDHRGQRRAAAARAVRAARQPYEPYRTDAERERYRAWGVAKAKSAFRDAFAGTGMNPGELNIVDNVKDAVKFIVRKFAERVERW